MERWLSRQTVTQAALTAAVLAALWIVFLVKPQPADAPPEGVAQQAFRPLESDDGDEDSPESSRAALRTMPAYQDARRSVGELSAARAALLKAAAAADGAATRAAAEDYRRTLEQVRSALAMLKGYVDPVEFSRCLQDLSRPQTEAELDSEAIPESLLGILPRVSPLPQEKLP